MRKLIILFKTVWFKVGVVLVTVIAAVAIYNVAKNKNEGVFHKCDFSIENIDSQYLYSEANCNEKAKYYYSCTCGKKGNDLFEYGDALGHDIIHHESKQVTCTTNGYNEYDTCSRCDYTTYEEILATGHVDGEWIIDVDATCLEGGSKHQVCSVCTKTLKTESISAKGHIGDEWIITLNATCLEDGERIKKCSRCKEIYEQEIIPAKGHTSSNWNIVTPKTCKTDGLKRKHCISCGETLKEEIIKASHNIVIDQKVEPTCTSEGLTEGQHCSDCNEVFINQVTINKIPHEIIVAERVEPTCTKNGLTEGKHCKNCSYVEIPQETIDSLGHSFVVETNACSRCNEKEYIEFKTLDEWNDGKNEKSYVVWLSYLGMDTEHYYYQTIPDTVEYVKLIGSPSEEYLLHLIIELRNKEITIEFVNVNLTSYKNHSIYCEVAIDINLNFYGKKCSLIPTKAQNGANGGFNNDPGYGTNGYSAIYAPNANVNIVTSAIQLLIIGGEGGNGGNGGYLGVSDTRAKPGADGGTGIIAGEINVRFAGQSTLKNIEIKGGNGGNGGKNGGYGAVSYAKNGNSGVASNVTINYITN